MANPNLFPQDVILSAQAAQKATGCWASVTLAQWAEESGYGKHAPPDSNNFFGIKASGDYPFVESQTKEEIHGKKVTIIARFRKFVSAEECFLVHGALLTSKTGPYAEFLPWLYDPLKWVQRFGPKYATDSQYSQKIIQLICQYDLRQYDKIIDIAVQPQTSTTTAIKAPPASKPNKSASKS